jgi:hypothetical protein
VNSLAAVEKLDPLASEALGRRFPHLAGAMDGDVMRPRLQRLLFDGTGFDVVACARPKADVKEDACWLVYPLQVRVPSGETGEVLVLGAMFSDRADAARFERATLAPQAARLRSSTLPAPRPTGIIESLGMVLSVYPVNGALPTLVDAIDPDRISEILRSVPAAGPDPAVVGVELVRFRRTRGCVIRYQLKPGADHAVIYGKVGTASAAASPEAVRDGLAGLARRPPPSGPGSIHIPAVLGHSPELDLTLVASVPGRRPNLRDEAELNAVVDGAALAAAWLHGSGLAFGRARGMEFELARAAQAVEQIRHDAPGLAGWLSSIVDSLGAAAESMPAQSLSLAHGDFTPSQILLAGSTIGVLDFDGLGQAEPAFDLGRFVAYLRLALARTGNVAGDSLASRFLEKYRAAGGKPAPQGRIEIYEIASIVRMAAHSWQQLKPARLRLACALLERQVERLPQQVRPVDPS